MQSSRESIIPFCTAATSVAVARGVNVVNIGGAEIYNAKIVIAKDIFKFFFMSNLIPLNFARYFYNDFNIKLVHFNHLLRGN